MAIPERWTDYKPIGHKISGTRFVAFKVPLRENISNTVDTANRLDEKILRSRIPKLGLIIDLTNTHRYYNPECFKKAGIDYVKIMIPGREIPTKTFSDKFAGIVNEFRKNNKNNDKQIGVHCTHGVNRTGYMICNYMITQMKIKPSEAIDRFENARGHNIEREKYVTSLKNLRNIDEQNLRNIKEPYAQQDNWRQRPDQRNHITLSYESESSNNKDYNRSNWRERSGREKSFEISRSSNYKRHETYKPSPYERSGYYYKSRRDESSRGQISDRYREPHATQYKEKLHVTKPNLNFDRQ